MRSFYDAFVARCSRARRVNSRRPSDSNRRNRLAVFDSLEDRVLLSAVAVGQQAIVLSDSRADADHGLSALVGWSNTPGAPAAVSVFLNDQGGSPFSSEQKTRVHDAIAELNRTWDSVLGLGLQLFTVDNYGVANIVVSTYRAWTPRRKPVWMSSRLANRSKSYMVRTLALRNWSSCGFLLGLPGMRPPRSSAYR